MSVEKRTMDRYDVRAKGEYATICIREWKNEQYFGGEILIHSSFGSWGNSWSACSNSFRRFLIGVDFDYIFGKFMGHDLRQFDGDASMKNLKQKMCKARRDRDIEQEESREVWDEIDAEAESLKRSLDSWVQTLMGIARLRSQAMRELLDEPWYMSADKPDQSAVCFWRDLWPEFVGALREEMSTKEPATNA